MAANPWDISQLKHMKIDEEDDIGIIEPAGRVIDPYEAERLVEGLRKFDISEIGTSEYIKQHQIIEKLNLQAHQCVLSKTDEYVLEAILTFDKLSVLVHDLLIIELWKENVYPNLIETLAGKNTIRLYFILYHEATLINLFEVIIFHKHVVEMGGETMLELVDYCARKLTRLNSGYNFRLLEPSGDLSTAGIKATADALASRSPKDEVTQHFSEIEFKVCLASVSLARFLIEHGDVLPLSVVSRITDTHDLLMLLLPLIENPPWTRRLSKGTWQKLINNKWEDVKPIDLLKVTKLEGQPWIALFHLLGKQIFREKYLLNSYRKGQLLRVRKFINDVLLDQLPFLADIQRYMDELAISNAAESNSLASGVFMFQQVAVLRESLMKGKKWNEIADYQVSHVFTMTDKDDPDLRALADMYSDDALDDIVHS